MSTLTEITRLIESLTDEDVHKLRDWIEDYAEMRWDCEIERDLDSGRLDGLLEQARKDFREGRAAPLPPFTIPPNAITTSARINGGTR